jgi:hypothetical protein
MTKRHNQLANVVRKAVETFLSKDLRSEIQENEQIDRLDLSDEVRKLRPDMVFERSQSSTGRRPQRHRDGEEGGNEAREMIEHKTMEIIEFSCPYGYVSERRDSLRQVDEKKKMKYAGLAKELKEQTNEEVRVTAVIVSSLGAVYLPSSERFATSLEMQ